MRVHLERYGFGTDTTLGKLYVPGELHPVFTLEDEVRTHKVPGETAIWEGTYRLELRTEGGFHQRYSERFGDMHKGMLWLRDVAEFEWILIHAGNTEDDTAGCILVGEQPNVDSRGEFSVLSSTAAYKRIYPPIARAIESGEGADIRVTKRFAERAA